LPSAANDDEMMKTKPRRLTSKLSSWKDLFDALRQTLVLDCSKDPYENTSNMSLRSLLEHRDKRLS